MVVDMSVTAACILLRRRECDGCDTLGAAAKSSMAQYAAHLLAGVPDLVRPADVVNIPAPLSRRR